MIGDIFLLVVGFIVLVKGADLLVDGAGSLTKRFGISELVIGLTVVSFGTSAPELAVNILSAFEGKTDLALGNIVGSTISNTLLILGAAAIIYPLAIHRNTVWREIPLATLAVLAVIFLANDGLIDGQAVSAITRSDGLVLLLLFSIFLYYTYGVSRIKGERSNPDIKQRPWPKALLLVISGMAGLAIGAAWIVNSAVSLASNLGVSESIIGLSILAIGTSVPELATSVMAAWRKNTDIAVGNVVGSNIFNLLFVLALTSLAQPLPLSQGLNVDMLIMLASSFLLFFFIFNSRQRRLERWEGYLFLIAYAVYIGFLALR